MQIEELENILLTLCYKDENEKAALKAFNLLYKSYGQLLSAIVKKGLKDMNIYDEQLYQAVINNVFLKIYDNPFSFEIPKNAKNDNCFKSWLSVVAKNELKAQIKQSLSKEDSMSVLKEEPSIESDEVDDNIVDSINFKLMSDALSTLSTRDRAIMITLYNYYEEGKNTPSEVLNDLSKIHNTTKLNIRKIKERSEKKIINFFSEHSQLKPVKNGK